MDASIIKIKCPNCGAVLQVKYLPGIENKVVKCPICKEPSPFGSFKRMDAVEDDETHYPQKHSGEHAQPAEETLMAGTMNFTLGRLHLEGTSQPAFRLKAGRNVIGRKASASSADIQIDTAQSRRMSREHVLVDVRKVPGKGFVHYVSLVKEKVNPTYLNRTLLEYGDCLVMKSGDLLRLPDADLRFEIPDSEGTEI